MTSQWIPQVLSDRYEVRRDLGAGGTAVVLEARDRLLGRTVAVKVLLPHLGRDPAFRERFQREARSAAQLSHPNIVAIYDVGNHQGDDGDEIDYIVLEYVEGGTLRDELGSGPLPPRRAVTIARDVCAALQAAHAAGMVHRDIKPANVMLTPSGQVKVMDFGLAQAMDGARLTQTGLVIATAQYASPEQLQGQSVDTRSDVYSLGCCLYEMLAGAPPFSGGGVVSVAFRQVNEPPPPLVQLDPKIPPGVAAVVARAMEKDPALRYQSAAETYEDLSRVLAGEEPLAAGGGTQPLGVVAWAGDGPPPGSGADGLSADGLEAAGVGAAGLGAGGLGAAGLGAAGADAAGADAVGADAPGTRPRRGRIALVSGVAVVALVTAGLAVRLFGVGHQTHDQPAAGTSAPPATTHAGPTSRPTTPLATSTSAAPSLTRTTRTTTPAPSPTTSAATPSNTPTTTTHTPPPTTTTTPTATATPTVSTPPATPSTTP